MNKKTLGYFLIVLSAVIFSTVELSIKSVSQHFAALQLTAIRFFVGGLCLIPFARQALKKKGRKLKAADLGFFLVMGLLFVVLSMVFHQMAIYRAPASAVAVLFSTNALFATLMAGLILKEPLGKNHYIALVFEVSAVILIIAPWDQKLDLLGLIFALIGAFIYACYIVAGKKRSGELGGIVITCGSVLFGSVELMLLLALGNVRSVAQFLQNTGLSMLAEVPLLPRLSWDLLPIFIYICTIVTAAGNVFHMIAVELTSAREAAVVFFLKPMLAPILAFLFLQENISLNMGIGIVLFLIGSAVALWGGRRKE